MNNEIVCREFAFIQRMLLAMQYTLSKLENALNTKQST